MRLIQVSSMKLWIQQKASNINQQRKGKPPIMTELTLFDLQAPAAGWTNQLHNFPDFSDIAIRDFSSHTGKQKKG